MRASDQLLVAPTPAQPVDAANTREGLKLIGARFGETANVILGHLDDYFIARRRRVPAADERSMIHGSELLGMLVGQLLVRDGWRWVSLAWKDAAPVKPVLKAARYRRSTICYGVIDLEAAWLVLPMQDLARVYCKRSTPVAFAAGWARLQSAARPEAGALELFELAPAKA